MADPADRPADDVATLARAIAQAHDAAILVAALVVRLRADGRPEHAAAVARVFAAEEGEIIDPNPGNPHKTRGP